MPSPRILEEAPAFTRPDGGPIRLLMLLPMLSTGGIERLVSDLAVGLRARRVVVTVGAFQGGAFADEIARNGFDLTVIGNSVRAHGRLPKLAGLRRALKRLLAADVDIVHTHHLGMLLHVLAASWPRRRRWRWVHTEHTHIDNAYPALLTRLAAFLLRRPDVLTGVSDAVCDYYIKAARIPAPRVHAIYNGIDVERFASPRMTDKRRELGIPPEAWVVGTVANLRAEKNHALALRAFAKLRCSVPEARLVFAGEGDLLPALQTQAHDLGIAEAVSFLGARRDVPELLAMFDVYCLPSHFEGMPLSVLEAMAAGCPVVATAVLGIREVVQDGVTGMLVPPDDADALATTLRRVRADHDLAARLKREGRHYVDEHARLDVMCQRYAELYARLLGGGRHA